MANIENNSITLTDLEFQELLKKTIRSSKTVITRYPPHLIINGSKVAASRGLTQISGAEKSGKSALTQMIIAKYLDVNSESIYDTKAMEVLPNKKGKAIIHFDTEQSDEDHIDGLKNIEKRASQDQPNWFYSYGLAAINFLKYQDFVDKTCEFLSKKHKGVHAIFIDGGADFVPSVNDEVKSNQLLAFFTEIAHRFECPVYYIMHTNPNSSKERGHLGSGSGRKCYATVQVEIDDKAISSVKITKARRGRSGDGFKFKWSDEHMMHMESDEEYNEGSDLNLIKIEQNKIDAASVLGQSSYTYTEVRNKTMEVLIVSSKSAERKIKFWKDNAIVSIGSDRRYRLNN